MHDEPHRLRGKTIPLLIGTNIVNYRVEDWADRVLRDRIAARAYASMVYGHILDGEHPTGLAKLVEDDWLSPPTEEEIIDRWTD